MCRTPKPLTQETCIIEECPHWEVEDWTGVSTTATANSSCNNRRRRWPDAGEGDDETVGVAFRLGQSVYLAKCVDGYVAPTYSFRYI